MSYPRLRSTTLPSETWDLIIDMLALDEDGSWTERRAYLRVCSLVCRAWVHRCRFYLVQYIRISSSASLQIAVQLLQDSRWAHRVLALEICGADEQSWISIVPLRLPKLPHLRRFTLLDIDLSQQHAEFPRLLSLFKPPARSYFQLVVSSAQLHREPARIASLARAVHATDVSADTQLPYHSYPVMRFADVSTLNSWPRSLTSRMRFSVRGNMAQLAQILRDWRFPVAHLEAEIDATPLGGASSWQHAQDYQFVWRKVVRLTRDVLRSQTRDSVEFGTVKVVSENAVVLVELFGTWDTLRHTRSACISVDSATDDFAAVSDLACVLCSLASYAPSRIRIDLDGFSLLSSTSWRDVDRTLTSLGTLCLRSVELDLWSSSVLSYKTVDEFAEGILPISSANGLIQVGVAYEDETQCV